MTSPHALCYQYVFHHDHDHGWVFRNVSGYSGYMQSIKHALMENLAVLFLSFFTVDRTTNRVWTPLPPPPTLHVSSRDLSFTHDVRNFGDWGIAQWKWLPKIWNGIELGKGLLKKKKKRMCRWLWVELLSRDKSVLPLRLAKTGLLFHVVAFWSRFRKFCFHSKNKLCAFPIFGVSCVKRRPTHVFIILTSRSFRTNSPFALSSRCRRLNLWESWQ